MYDDGKEDDFVDSPNNIKDNLKTLNTVLVSCGSVFMLLAIISFVLGKTKFKGIEGKKAKILDRNDLRNEGVMEFNDYDKDGQSQN